MKMPEIGRAIRTTVTEASMKLYHDVENIDKDRQKLALAGTACTAIEVITTADIFAGSNSNRNTKVRLNC